MKIVDRLTVLPRCRRPLIAFTGPDGAGKSTQIALLRSELMSHGLTVAVVHQYDPITGAIGAIKRRVRQNRGVALHSLFARPGTFQGGRDPSAEDPRPHATRLARRIIVFWWLVGGWWRSFVNARLHRDWDVLLLDRCYIDEIVRSVWKGESGQLLGMLLIARLPPPDVVFELQVETPVSWSRKKSLNSSPLEYQRKVAIVQQIMRDVRPLWRIRVISVAHRSEADVAAEIRTEVIQILAGFGKA